VDALSEILTQSLLSSDAKRVSSSFRPLKGGGRSFILAGTSQMPRGM
jgi:hypothetical protein